MKLRVIVVTDPQANKHTHKQKPHRHDRLQYTAPQLASAQCKKLKTSKVRILGFPGFFTYYVTNSIKMIFKY